MFFAKLKNAINAAVIVICRDCSILARRGQGKGEFSGPEVLCVIGDYVYVTEWSILVFHTSVELVHSLEVALGPDRSELLLKLCCFNIHLQRLAQ